MYQLTIKGKNLEEFKKAVTDFYNELCVNNKFSGHVEKDMSVKEEIDEALKQETPTELPINETMVEEVPVEDTRVLEPVVNMFPEKDKIETPAALETPTNPNAELDIEGLPWDARIHTIKKTKVTSGTWKVKRGCNPDMVHAVKASLRNAAPVVAPTPTAPSVVAPVAPVVAPTPTALPLPNTQGGHTVETFTANFPMVLAGLITEGKLSQEYVNTLKTHFAVAEICDVNDAQKAEMFESFVQHNLIIKV